MPSVVPYWNLYTKDWLASSTVMDMSVTAEGIYFRLCVIQWEDGSLPVETEKLVRRCRADQEEWAKFEPFLDKCFPTTKCGCRQNKRVAFDRDQTMIAHAKKVEGGRATARKRWDKEKDLGSNDSLAIGELIAKQPLYTEPEPEESKDSILSNFLERFRSEYPKRDGDLGWAKARLKLQAIPIKEHESVIQGVIAYRKHMEIKERVNTEFIKRMPTFISGKCWNEDWTVKSVNGGSVPLHLQNG